MSEDSEALARAFFDAAFSRAPVSLHEEWLWRQYSKVMHRELELSAAVQCIQEHDANRVRVPSPPLEASAQKGCSLSNRPPSSSASPTYSGADTSTHTAC